MLSHARISAPGIAIATVTRKKRNPAAKAASADTPSCPRKLDEERLAHGKPVDRERDEHDEEEQRAHHVVHAGRQVDAHRLGRTPDGEHAHGLDGERQREDA